MRSSFRRTQQRTGVVAALVAGSLMGLSPAAEAAGGSSSSAGGSSSSGKSSKSSWKNPFKKKQTAGQKAAQQQAETDQGVVPSQGRPPNTYLNGFGTWKTPSSPGAVSTDEATALDREIAMAGGKNGAIPAGQRAQRGTSTAEVYGNPQAKWPPQLVVELSGQPGSRGIVRYQDRAGGVRWINVRNNRGIVEYVSPGSGKVMYRPLEDVPSVQFFRTDLGRPTGAVYPPPAPPGQRPSPNSPNVRGPNVRGPSTGRPNQPPAQKQGGSGLYPPQQTGSGVVPPPTAPVPPG
jgi:hypothetical protein